MESKQDIPTREQYGEAALTLAPDDENYSLLTDEQLKIERDRLKEQLDELTAARGSSHVDCQLLVNIEGEIEHMMDELLQRARSRHPSSGGLSARLRLRPVPSLQRID
jgi:hypothetical protein